MLHSRRQFISNMGAISLGGISLSAFSSQSFFETRKNLALFDHLTPEETADDEDFWFFIQQAYTPSLKFINLNSGGVCPQPKVVQESFQHYMQIANQAPAYYLFQEFAQQREQIKKKLAQFSGCAHDEISLCRNTTEAMETVIFGLDLKKDDEIITTTHDYPTVMAALDQRARRDGIRIIKISIPAPAEDKDELVSLFENAITKKTKLIVVSHINFTTGQIMPAREICDMAHEQNVEVAVDGAHSFAQLDYKISDLHCDYFGTSLHKWLNAPFGCGMLYMKKEKIEKIWSLFGSPEDQKNSMLKFEHLGTRNFPAEMAINEALDFQNGITTARKEARLRFLKNYWARAVAELPKVRLNTSLKNEFACGLCHFSISGMKADEMYHALLKDHKIFTTLMNFETVEGIRISPNVFTKISDLDHLIKAITLMAS